MDFKPYLRKPFEVQAVIIDENNFEEVSELIGTEVRELEDGGLCIIIDKRVIPAVNRAFVGWVLTRMGNTYKVYNPKAFADQFEEKQSARNIGVDQNTGYFEDATVD